MELPALGSLATQRRHVGLGPGLVDEDLAPGVGPAVVLLPLLAPAGDPGLQLFGRQHTFFKLSSRTWTKRQTWTSSTCTPFAASLATRPRKVKSLWVRASNQSAWTPDRMFGL